MNSKKSDEEVFALLKLDETDVELLFKSPAYSQWVSFVTRSHKDFPKEAYESLHSILSSHFGDAWELLLAGTPVDASTVLLKSMQVKKWHTDKKTPIDVFTLLKLDKAKGELLFESPAFLQWVSFITSSRDITPQKAYESMSTFLPGCFGGRWDVLLAGAPVDSSAAVLQLKNMQLKKWHNDEKTAEDIYERLKLDRIEGKQLFKNPSFLQWVSFITSSQKTTPQEAYESLSSILSRRFGNSWEVLLEGTPVDASAAVLQMKSMQIDRWLADKKSPRYVFILLDFHEKKGGLLFESPAFPQWVSFFASYHKGSPQETRELLYSFLSSRFEDAWDVVLAGTPVDASAAVLQLKSMQIDRWHTDKKSPKDIFELLKLDKTEGELLFENPVFPQWVSFITSSREKTPQESYESLSSFFSSYFEGAWDMLLAETPSFASAAVHQLRRMQLQKWQNDKKSLDEIFNLLNLHLMEDTSLFHTPTGNTWLSYLYLLEGGSDSKVLDVLQAKFGEARVAAMLSFLATYNKQAAKLPEAQYKNWLARNLTPTKVNYRILSEYPIGDKLCFTNGYEKYIEA